MEDSENGGKGEIQERNRTVVYLPREKVKREILSFWGSVLTGGKFSSFSIQIESLRFQLHAEISCQSNFPPAPARNRPVPRPLHLKKDTSVCNPCDFKTPRQTARKWVMNRLSPKGKPPYCTTFVVQFVPGLLTTLLSSGNTPGIDYGALAKIQNPWRRRRTLPE
jgi:hypothetical protein